MPALKDMVTVLYRPRETMRKVLDEGRSRWTAPLVITACLASLVGDSDLDKVPDLAAIRETLPGISIPALFALGGLVVIAMAIFWVLMIHVFAWIATMVGRWLEGQGLVADVRAALAWGLVPVIWSLILRIPLAAYEARMDPGDDLNPQAIGDFIASGGCSILVLIAAFHIATYVWMAYVASGTVGEALRFSSWKGLGTIAISIATPFIIVIAAMLTMKS